MIPTLSIIRQNPLIGFVVLAFVWSWLWWAPAVAAYSTGMSSNPMSQTVGLRTWLIATALVGAYGPTISAFLVVGITGGRNAALELLRGVIRWKSGSWWHFVAWMLPIIWLGIALGVFVVEREKYLPFAAYRAQMILPVLAINLIGGPLGEEFGWRGFWLARLQAKRSALSSALLIGVVWSAWHLPLYWAPMGTMLSGARVTLAAVGEYFVLVSGLSVVFTWIYNNSRGSLIPVVVLHLGVNARFLLLFFPSLSADEVRYITELTIIPIWLTALGAILIWGPGRLARKPVVSI